MMVTPQRTGVIQRSAGNCTSHLSIELQAGLQCRCFSTNPQQSSSSQAIELVFSNVRIVKELMVVKNAFVMAQTALWQGMRFPLKPHYFHRESARGGLYTL